jgi:hypothetical protein
VCLADKVVRAKKCVWRLKINYVVPPSRIFFAPAANLKAPGIRAYPAKWNPLGNSFVIFFLLPRQTEQREEKFASAARRRSVKIQTTVEARGIILIR